MKISTAVLKDALDRVAPGIGKNALLPILESFAFKGGVVSTFSGDLTIQHPVPDLADLDCVVSSEEFYKVIGKITGDEIEVILKEGELILKSGRIKAGLTIFNSTKDFFFHDIEGSVTKWHPLPDKFIDHLKFCIPVSNPKDMLRPVVGAVHVNKKGFIESTDNNRIAHCYYGEKFAFETFLLPSESAKKIIHIPLSLVANGQGWVYFKSSDGDTVIGCRVIDDKFPRTEDILKLEVGENIQLPQMTAESINRAMVFAKLYNRLTISLTKNRMTLKSQSDTGWYEETLNVAYDSEPFAITINPEFLKYIIDATDRCLVSPTNHRVLFEGDDWKYLTMLIINM